MPKKVTLKTIRADRWGAEYQVIVKGCGMDDEVHSKLFQNFFQHQGNLLDRYAV